VAAFRELTHPELLQLVGSTQGMDRRSLYRRCRSQLSAATRRFWDAHQNWIDAGIGSAGRFERYLALFRHRVLPLVHRRATVTRLLEGRSREERERFYREQWDTWRWRGVFRLFFSRTVMGRLGRDPSFFRYVDGQVADRLLARTRHALTELDPAANPYVQWILTGRHLSAWPRALRPEYFDRIRDSLDRLEWRATPIEEFVTGAGSASMDWFNLSDIFEYMSERRTGELLEAIARSGRRGARLAYWNTFVPRARPDELSDRLRPLASLAERLHHTDKAFFYGAFVVEEVC
jgi:S-adenosylmethionine-diacylglycerol 3-amino-3-carboxypropyl transferase